MRTLIGYECEVCHAEGSVAWYEGHLEANPDHDKFRAIYGEDEGGEEK